MSPAHEAKGNRFERAKVARLQHHLSGGWRIPDFARANVSGRLAQRIRADLADIVPFGGGFHLRAAP